MLAEENLENYFESYILKIQKQESVNRGVQLESSPKKEWKIPPVNSDINWKLQGRTGGGFFKDLLQKKFLALLRLKTQIYKRPLGSIDNQEWL